MPRNKRLIVEDEKVPNEVKLLEENVDTVTKRHKYTDASFYKLIEEFYQTKTNKSVPFSNDIKRNALALLIMEYPDLTRIQGDQIIRKCANKCRDHINTFTGKKTTTHSTIRKLYDDKSNFKKQLKAAEENHAELLLMFQNGTIKEKPLNKVEAMQLVRGLFEREDSILNQTNTSIYTGYTGVGLDNEPYRY